MRFKAFSARLFSHLSFQFSRDEDCCCCHHFNGDAPANLRRPSRARRLSAAPLPRRGGGGRRLALDGAGPARAPRHVGAAAPAARRRLGSGMPGRLHERSDENLLFSSSGFSGFCLFVRKLSVGVMKVDSACYLALELSDCFFFSFSLNVYLLVMVVNCVRLAKL